MTPAGLQAFRARVGWNRSQLAERLGCDRKALGGYLAGKTRIPRYIALACSALEAGAGPTGDEPAEGTEP